MTLRLHPQVLATLRKLAEQSRQPLDDFCAGHLEQIATAARKAKGRPFTVVSPSHIPLRSV